MVTQGYKPFIEDLEMIMYGLLRHSDEVNAQMLFNSIEHYELKRRAATFNLWIGYFLREQQPEKARALFRDMEKSGIKPNQSTFLEFLSYFVEKADYKAAEAIREYMKSRRIPVDVRFYNGMIDRMGRKMALTEIENLLEEMKSANIPLNLHTYNLLIRTFASINQHEKINGLLDEMRSKNIMPTTQTFNRMLLSLSSSITPEQTREVLQQMSKMGLTFNSYTYSALISNLLKQEKYREAIEMIYELERRGLVLAVESYGAILKTCCEKRVEPAVQIVWNQMRKNEIPPNTHIFSILVRHYLMRRNYSRVDGLLLEMRRKWGLKPNPFLFSTLLNHYVESLDFTRIKALIQMIQDSGVEINSVLYNVIMKSFYSYSRYQQGGHIARLKGIDSDLLKSEGYNMDDVGKDFNPQEDPEPMDVNKLKTQFEKLFNLPFKPTVHVYNEMMLSFFIRERFTEMFDCLNEMRQSDVAPNLTSYTFMIKARIFQGDISSARTLLREMSRVGLHPSILHCAIFFHSYCRKMLTSEAEEFLKEMENVYHIRPNHVFYGSLIYAYTRRREYSMVFNTFERMEKAGFVPDTETCNYVLISLLEINEFKEARKFFEKMLLQGIRRNAHTYSYLANGFLARRDDASLLAILADCTTPGNTIDAYPFNQVLSYYYQTDQMDELIKVLQLMIDYSVQFDRSTVPFIQHVFQRDRLDMEILPKIIKIVKKMLVDVSTETSETIIKIQDDLREALLLANLKEELELYDSFLVDLSKLRQRWTAIDPNILEHFDQQFQVDYEGYSSIPSDQIDKIRHQINAIVSKRQDSLRDLFGIMKRQT